VYPASLASQNWLDSHQYLALWMEGIALVFIFGLDWWVYRKSVSERKEQHKEAVEQMRIAKETAEAAKLSAQAVLNSERAWIEIRLGAPLQPDYREEAQTSSSDVFECSIQIENHGRTVARIESLQVGVDTLNEPLPQEPVNFTKTNLHSVLGSGQKETIGRFTADDFLDWQSIVDGTKRGILRITVKYRNVVDTSTLHETSLVYVFQNSLEDPPERVSFLSVYT
jgi:hypothetical protein